MIPSSGDRRAGGDRTEGSAVVEGFLDNQPAAVAVLAGWARQVAHHRAWGFESPEDIVQATLLTLVTSLREGRFQGGNLRAYVQRIAKNMCVSSYRRTLVRSGTIPLEDAARLPDPDAGDRERELTLQQILARLDAACRRIIVMAYLQGLDRAEIARRLGINVGSARVKLYRCLATARGFASEREST